ncbi:alpha-ketoglutarate-dependent dioxygenase AlkB [Halobacteriovorax sp.]|uniref:alpha-ketoglutarate-dependent dioxygenase AlkB family protein n=1 Tax=Halobacteriovorax sp. TaxID=2020862 RepID=UPI0035616106
MNQSVFKFDKEVHSFNNGEILYYPNFFSSDYLPLLKEELHWRSDKISMFGKTHPIPRLQCWYGDENISYEYSNIQIEHNSWNVSLIKIKKMIEAEISESFNGMLGNYYRNGEDYVSWHSDDEVSLGERPTIACASFGVSRVFSFRNKISKEKFSLNLEDRSLLVMLPPTQKDWEHQINKSKSITGERISLTFRFVHQ